MLKHINLLLVILLFTVAVSGCGQRQADSSEMITAELWVTQNFAADTIFDEKVSFASGDSVMKVLSSNLDVETAYGGGFVNAIEGLKSEPGKDWFYYMNGVLSSNGSTQYIPQQGDVIWWEYHEWGGISFVPAVIGTFPKPFAKDDSESLILYTEGGKQAAHNFELTLKNNSLNAKPQPINDSLILDRSCVTAVVGLCSELNELSSVKSLFENHTKTGLFFKIANDKIITLDVNGTDSKVFGLGSGAVAATAAGLGDPNPLWIIAGTDETGLNAAVDVLENSPEDIRKTFGVVINGDEIIKIPVTVK
jgi:hypothetical protein